MRIESTRDYSLFKRIAGNREINPVHIERLRESIEHDAGVIEYNPIIVNDRMEVIDGQHRLEAIKKLRLPVYYIKQPNLKLEEVQKLNSLTRIWTPVDYARSYRELGNKNYSLYLEFKSKYHLTHNVMLVYLSPDKHMTAQMFKEGKFVITDPELSHKYCRCLVDIGKYYQKYDHKNFGLAFIKLLQNPHYDHKRMLYKLSMRYETLKDYSLMEDYIRALEAIYNWHETAEERVRFF